MKFNKNHPYYRRLWWRTKLPWFLIDKGFAQKGEDCAKVKADHHWYNINKNQSGCYYCNVVKDGKLWEK